MKDVKEYLIPDRSHRAEIQVSNSRFIASVNMASTVEDARMFIAQTRNYLHDASHHVYAYRIGFGNSTHDGMSDDGEPTGTAGPPVLAVLRGSAIGDVVVVVSRYFGGTLLGTGGLVRAYSEAARQVLSEVKTIHKVVYRRVVLDLPYPLYTPIRNLINAYHGAIETEMFAADVQLAARVPLNLLDAFQRDIVNVSAGKVNAILSDSDT